MKWGLLVGMVIGIASVPTYRHVHYTRQERLTRKHFRPDPVSVAGLKNGNGGWVCLEAFKADAEGVLLVEHDWLVKESPNEHGEAAVLVKQDGVLFAFLPQEHQNKCWTADQDAGRCYSYYVKLRDCDLPQKVMEQMVRQGISADLVQRFSEVQARNEQVAAR